MIDGVLTEDPEVLDDCGTCNACTLACPTGAIQGNYLVDAHRCLSYLTQKKHLKVSEEQFLNSCVYGCDICQLVCPKNIVFESDLRHIFDSQALLEMSNRQFKKVYANRDFSWRGASIIRRNIILSSKNKE
jgi:epoxyqueuosine reductase